VGGYKVTGFEDWDFWIAVGSLGHEGYYLAKPLFKYRNNSDGRYQKDLIFEKFYHARIVLNHPSVYSANEIINAGVVQKNHFIKNLSLKEGPLLSVIIPTYNRPDLLKNAILSVLNQTYKNIEIIVINILG
jgi:hypothetical protein